MMMVLVILDDLQVQYGNFKRLKLGRPKSIQNLGFFWSACCSFSRIRRT